MTTNQSESGSVPAGRVTIGEYLRAGLVALLCALMAYSVYETMLRIAASYSPIPVGDYWRVPQFLHAYQTFELEVFWRQHNEHRILFPEIVFALDMLVAHGRMVLPTVLSFLCYAGSWGVLCYVFARSATVPVFARWCGVLVAGVLTFWQGAAVALAQPFLLEWPLMQLGVVLAIFLLTKTADAGRALFLALTVGAAVLATYSSANALLLWPLLVTLGFALRLTKRFQFILAGCAIVFVGLYFVGYHFSGQSNFGALLQHPLYFASFSAMYLSMPFSNLFSSKFGITLGLLNFALVMGVAVSAWRKGLWRERTPVVLLSFYVFTLLTIVITAGGRMDLADQNYSAARAPRYLTVSLLNWAAVILLCYWASSRLRWKFVGSGTLTILFTVLTMLGTYKLRNWQEANEVPQADAQISAMHLDAGLTDTELEARLFPSPEFLDKFLPPLKSQHLALFSRQHERWLGAPLTQFGRLADERAAGQINSLWPIEHGLAVVGWVNSTDVRDPFPRILLVNEKNQVVGWGRRPNAGLPAEWRSLETPQQEAWIAFANLNIASRSIAAYAVTRHGLAAVGGVNPVPALKAVNGQEVGAPLSSVAWKMDATWALNGIPVIPTYGWHPKGAAYSSWQQHDEHTGQIVAEFDTPKTNCVSVGVLHGPSTDGLSLQFIDADSGAVLGDVPFRDHDFLWSLWQVKLTAGTKRVRIVGNDKGAGWGQWLAVSEPLQCQER